MRDLDYSKIFSDELLETVEKKQNENETKKNLRRIVDGEPKNVNPLTEIPEPQMRLYGFSGAFNSAYFDTEEELIEYVKTHNITFGSICVIEYLGNVAGCSDVIRQIYKSGKSVLYAAVDEDGYRIYNQERSIYRGEFIWEYNYGRISKMYSAFRDRGIIFENDIYAKIDERDRQLMAVSEESRKQVLTKKRTPNNLNDKNN